MIRHDGMYTVFVIQHKYKREGRWVTSNLDAFKTSSKTRDIFASSNDCWQQTGINGTYSERAGRAALFDIAKNNEQHQFRLARVVIEQKTDCVAEADGTKVTYKW